MLVELIEDGWYFLPEGPIVHVPAGMTGRIAGTARDGGLTVVWDAVLVYGEDCRLRMVEDYPQDDLFEGDDVIPACGRCDLEALEAATHVRPVLVPATVAA